MEGHFDIDSYGNISWWLSGVAHDWSELKGIEMSDELLQECKMDWGNEGPSQAMYTQINDESLNYDLKLICISEKLSHVRSEGITLGEQKAFARANAWLCQTGHLPKPSLSIINFDNNAQICQS